MGDQRWKETQERGGEPHVIGRCKRYNVEETQRKHLLSVQYGSCVSCRDTHIPPANHVHDSLDEIEEKTEENEYVSEACWAADRGRLAVGCVRFWTFDADKVLNAQHHDDAHPCR